uniref:Uncharacterized protein n=1 Tax=uncultured marine virus TaxID=186617 RepID=A0A0F7L5Z9_9VIRU|nr:hypothetical protein [uncultured marine virus]
MLKRGILRYCENCDALYGQYNLDGNSDWEEYWSISGEKKEGVDTKGVCQFCNPKSSYYNK